MAFVLPYGQGLYDQCDSGAFAGTTSLIVLGLRVKRCVPEVWVHSIPCHLR